VRADPRSERSRPRSSVRGGRYDAAIDSIRRDVEAVEKPALANFARTDADAASLAKQGFHFVCLSTTAIFTRRLADLIADLKP
jgi:2-keto-3-deoxy-L-rhamnonate aldolase RhmA